MDVFEILQDVRHLPSSPSIAERADPALCAQYDPNHHVETEEPPEDSTPLPLEGTSDDAVSATVLCFVGGAQTDESLRVRRSRRSRTRCSCSSRACFPSA